MMHSSKLITLIIISRTMFMNISTVQVLLVAETSYHGTMTWTSECTEKISPSPITYRTPLVRCLKMTTNSYGQKPISRKVTFFVYITARLIICMWIFSRFIPKMAQWRKTRGWYHIVRTVNFPSGSSCRWILWTLREELLLFHHMWRNFWNWNLGRELSKTPGIQMEKMPTSAMNTHVYAVLLGEILMYCLLTYSWMLPYFHILSNECTWNWYV